MRLAAKLTAALVLGFCAVMVPFARFQVRREATLFERELAKDQHSMGRTLALAIHTASASSGPAAATDLVRRANDTVPGVRFRWIPLDGPDVDPTIRDRFAGIPSGGDRMLVVADEAGVDHRFTYVPVVLAGGEHGGLELRESLAGQHAFVRATKMQIFLSSAVIVVLSSLLATLLGFWMVGAPMRRLAQKARRVGEGDFGGRLDERQHDEIGELAHELNAMSDQLAEAQRRVASETEARIATVEQLRHADRLKTIGQLASGVAHELGTPLNVIAGRAKLIAAGDQRAGDPATNAKIITQQADRMTTIIRQLLDFSRRRGPHLHETDLRTVAEQATHMLAPLAEKRHVRVELDGPPAPVFADQSQLEQVLTNVMVNGIQAMDEGGVLRIAVTADVPPPAAATDGATTHWSRCDVSDGGSGIDPEHLSKVFEPFFTTKGVGEGTGLGLSVAYGIVRDHGGWIDVRSTVGRGTTFSIYLPAAHGAPTVAAERTAT